VWTLRVTDYYINESGDTVELFGLLVNKDDLTRMFKVHPVECDILYAAKGSVIIERESLGAKKGFVMPEKCIYEKESDCETACEILNHGLDIKDPDTVKVIEDIQKLNTIDIDRMADKAMLELMQGAKDFSGMNREQRREVIRKVKKAKA